MITGFAVLLLLAVALAPLIWSLRRQTRLRDRRDAALALHRAQLSELDRDMAEGRLLPAQHAAARLEVQRRLLAAADLAEPAAAGRRWPIAAALVVVPLAATALYLVHGKPGMPAMPIAARMAEARRQDAEAEQLIDRLRTRLASMDQTSERAREGYVLLGNAEDGRGHLAEAADAWRKAVAIRFDPNLAALAAEARTQVDGGVVDADSAELFARALSEGPQDAPWRPLAEKRLSQTGLR